MTRNVVLTALILTLSISQYAHGNESYRLSLNKNNYTKSTQFFSSIFKDTIFQNCCSPIKNDCCKKWVSQGYSNYNDLFSVSEHKEYIKIQPSQLYPGQPDLYIKPKLSRKQHIYLQIIHQFYDKKTGQIGRLWFESSAIDVLTINNISRNKQTIRGEKTDLGKLTRTYLTSSTEALLELSEMPLFIQVHGFSNSKRNSAQGKAAEIIISSGSKIVSKHVKRSYDCLRRSGYKVELFPNTIRELGGTKNTTGMLVNNSNKGYFIHLELNFFIRNRILVSRVDSDTILQCIVGVDNV